ncbi:MAG TPA: flagellar hook-basal body complex protein FliE [Gemmataceae bacterium]|nr:flagellar hook-basal body complex protein FliE [Gemmataceae bacterium]
MAISDIGPIGLGPTLDLVCRQAPGAAPDGPFARAIDKYLREAHAKQEAADQAIMDLATGKTENIHEVMLAVTKADLTFRTVLQVRNRLTEAYQDITRMAV